MSFGLGQIAVNISRNGQNSDHVVDIVEFVSSPWGLHFDGLEGRPRLFPVQMTILKAHYGLELDNISKFSVWKDWRQKEAWSFTEKEYLEYLYNEGRCNIKEVDHDRREMVLVIGRRSGKCILGDSLVLTDRGIVRIDTLGDPDGQEVQPFDVLVVQEGGQKAHSKFFYNGGIRHTRTLTTQCGYQLGGTDNHRIKVLTEQGIVDWKYLADLKVGDIVCLLKGTNFWASDSVISEEQGLAIGYSVGEHADTQVVPQSIMQSPKLVVQAFLRGLFESADLTNFNYKLAHEVQVLLLNLGIISQISSDDKVCWGVSIDSSCDQELGYFFDPVVSIEEGINPVFDLNVPDGESFVANGLVNHNTFLAAAISAYETYKLLMKGSPQKYYGLPPGNQIGIVSVATSTEQASILYNEVSSHYRNCFAAETEIITADGVKPIGSLAGSVQTLLTTGGAWVDAPISSFGKQKLWKIVLHRQGIEKSIYCTEGHRWFVRDVRKAYRGKGFVEFTTKELRPGKHHLQAIFGHSYKNIVTPSPFGIAHGFTFGDGSTTAQRQATSVWMIGEKDSCVQKYFSLCPMRKNTRIDGVEASALPNFFRYLPSIRENKAYLLGWLMGYFAADGSVNNGQVTISSISRRNIEFVRDVCAVIGIGAYSISSSTRVSNLTHRPFTMYSLNLMRQTLDASFFLVPAHREKFLEAGGAGVKRVVQNWIVQSVEETDRYEEVFCATVEGYGAFALADNILTGNCKYFSPYTANNTQSYARFQTPQDIADTCRYEDDSGAARATLKVSFKSCIAKGLRGPGNIVIILDEEAHFTDNGQSSAEAVYNAITPSTATFSPKDPTNSNIPIGSVEGRIINISSPLAHQGQFYKLYQIGMKGGTASDTMLVVQAPTWEVNPTLPPSEFEKHYLKDPVIFYTEFGAEFSDRARGWIEREQDLLDCIDPNLRPTVQPPARRPHFMGIDVGLVGDGSAVAIGHMENRGDQKVIILDYLDQIKAGEGKYKDKERLDFSDVVDWIYEISRRFYIAHGMCDQYTGIPFEQALQKKGLVQIKSEHMTRDLNSDMFRNFKDMLYDRRLVLFDWPPSQEGLSNHCSYIQELLELQAETHSKYIITVQAPQMSGKHDDQSDALVRMVWLASQHISSPKYITGVRSGGVQGASPRAQAGFLRRGLLQARQTGTSPDRQRSRLSPGRIRGRY